MSPRLRNLVIALGLAGAIAGGAVLLRDNLPPEEMTMDEYFAYVEMLNYEIRQAGGTISMENIRGRNDILKELDTVIARRTVDEDSVIIGGETLTKREYKDLRKELLGKRK